MLLDQIKKPVLGSEVMIHTGERHAGGARKVAHGGASVTFVAEDFGGVFEDFAKLAVKAGLGRLTPQGSMGARFGSG
jgi:hypothetical protein